MDDEIKEYLSKITPKWRTRKIKQKPKYVSYLKNKYPSYSLVFQIQFLLSNLEVEPKCEMCGGVLNTPQHAKTCSRKCRDELKHKTGKYKESREKANKTNLKRYGVENPSQLKDVQEKRLSTMAKKYGSKVSPLAREKTKERAAELNIKGRKTLKERYGVSNPGQLEHHREKCKNTLLENYGVDNYYASEEFQSIKEKRRLDKWQYFSPDTVDVISVSDSEKQNYSNPNDDISFVCRTCGNEQTIPHETFKWRINNAGTPCITCSGIVNGSLKEREIKQFIKELGFRIIENDRYIISPLELDIVIPDKKIAIEFCGLFWHNDLRIEKEKHLKKLELCEEKGYRLITVFEDEYDYRKDVVFSRLRYNLNVDSNKIYARKCRIENIDTATEKEFLEQYHLQGYAKSSIKYGLYYEDVLVSVMTFSKLSKAKGHESKEGHWELLRFCSISDTSVVGGASKLFNKFILEHKPKKVISYADRRWGTGCLYTRLGFEHVGNTSPGYWYIQGNKRIHRYALRKNKYDDKTLTEYENRLRQGYLRIWDCGHAKFEW